MNVIWVVADTLRRDHVGVYGNKSIHTPSIDAFAAKSVRFNRHYIAGFPTMPTRADHMTGRWTMSFMRWEPLPNNVTTLPEILSPKDIHTAAVVDTPFYTRGNMNYNRGFISFYEIVGQDNKFHKEGVDSIMDRRYESDYFAPKTYIKAMRWLEHHYKEHFFLYIDTWDPHEPWDPPEFYVEPYWPGYDGEVIEPLYGSWKKISGYGEEKVKKAHACYCGEVTMVDTWFGHLLKKVENLGLMNNTAIIFTSDHGFYFGEHGGYFGKMLSKLDPDTGEYDYMNWTFSPLYEEVTAIPLLIYVPDIKSDTYNGLTSAVDVMPTVLEIMGQEIPPQIEGKSLLGMMSNIHSEGRKYVVSAQPFRNAGEITRAVDNFPRPEECDSSVTTTTDEWTLIYDSRPGLSELYNLKSDPGQMKNVIKEYPDKAREIHRLMIDYMNDTKVEAKYIETRSELRL